MQPIALDAQISKHNYNAYLWHALFLALAINFMDVETIIPAMMVDAGGSSFQLGILTAIMTGGGKLAQLLFAPFLHNRNSKKGYLLTGINTRVFSLIGMGLLFFFAVQLSNLFIIWSVFLLISLFAFGGSFANINYVDILGKSVLPKKRKSFFSIKQVISSIFVFLSAFLVRRILTAYHYPLNYATLFFTAAALLAIASAGFWQIKEVHSASFKIASLREFIDIMVREIRTNRKLRSYLFLTNTQGITIVLMPFLILYAKKVFSAGSQDIGNFLILKVIGGIVAGSILFYYSGRIKYRLMLYATNVIGILIPLFILLLPGETLFPYIFLVGGIAFTVHRISISGILLEVTTNENRALYTGLSGAGGILPVVFPFLAGWIIARFGFNPFLWLYIAVMFASFYFIHRMDCQK